MSVFSILGAGSRGMAANQMGAGVSAQNASNVGAPSYARRSLIPSAGGEGGVAPRRVVDAFVERRYLGASSAQGEASAHALSLQALDRVFSESEGGLGDSLDAFQVSVQDLANRPSDSATRSLLLSRADGLSKAFHSASKELSAAREDANQRIEVSIRSVNAKLHQIASLGGEIARGEVSGREASDLRDRRDALIREVAKEIPVSVLSGEQGSITLTLGGSQPLVGPDGRVTELSTARDASGDVIIRKEAAGADVDVTDLVTSGSAYGYLKARDGAITDAQTQLDQLVFDTGNAYNAVHRVGVGLDGGAGRLLFEVPTSVDGAALNFNVSSDVAGSPNLIGAGIDAASVPSDNRGALALSAVAMAPLAVSGMTVSEALASLVGGVGAAVQSASNYESFAEGALTQVESLYQSVSGVSSDEEMVSMVRYQRAYEASAKVVQVADEMLQTLLQLKR